MAGYEMLADPQRGLTAKSAAERLRKMSDLHFKDRSGHCRTRDHEYVALVLLRFVRRKLPQAA